MPVLVEACVDGVASAVAAETGGAGRLELCSELAEGGTTPPFGLVAAVRQRIGLPLHVLVRPRRAGFHYDKDELARICGDIAELGRLGVQGVVVGALDPSGLPALQPLRGILEAAGPLALTFHRAFDQVPDPFHALERLIELGVRRVLTSGRAPSAEAGIAVLAKLVQQANGRIVIMAGGGVRATNAAGIVRATGAGELHVGAGEAAEPGRIRLVVDSVRDPA